MRRGWFLGMKPRYTHYLYNLQPGHIKILPLVKGSPSHHGATESQLPSWVKTGEPLALLAPLFRLLSAVKKVFFENDALKITSDEDLLYLFDAGVIMFRKSSVRRTSDQR